MSTCICTGGLQTWFHNKLAGQSYHRLYRWDEYSKPQALCSSPADAAGDWQGCHPVPPLTRVRTVGLLSLHHNTSLPLSDISLPWFSSTSEPYKWLNHIKNETSIRRLCELKTKLQEISLKIKVSTPNASSRQFRGQKNEVRNTAVMKEVLSLGFACFYLSNARDGTWGLACETSVWIWHP